jgi:hypothetical protein
MNLQRSVSSDANAASMNPEGAVSSTPVPEGSSTPVPEGSSTPVPEFVIDTLEPEALLAAAAIAGERAALWSSLEHSAAEITRLSQPLAPAPVSFFRFYIVRLLQHLTLFQPP